MTPMSYIRRRIFRIKQSEMAAIAATAQSTVSRWEDGMTEPTREQMARIRTEARARKIRWRDAWFFDVPPADANSGTEAA